MLYLALVNRKSKLCSTDDALRYVEIQRGTCGWADVPLYFRASFLSFSLSSLMFWQIPTPTLLRHALNIDSPFKLPRLRGRTGVNMTRILKFVVQSDFCKAPWLQSANFLINFEPIFLQRRYRGTSSITISNHVFVNKLRIKVVSKFT